MDKITKLIQAWLAHITQIYDLFVYRNCERIEQFPENSPERAKFILETHRTDEFCFKAVPDIFNHIILTILMILTYYLISTYFLY
jgi:hypothetical protein